MLPLAVLIAGSVLVGYLGRHRRIGFLGFFIVSLVITPLLAVLVLLLSADGRVGRPAT